jgi:Leucine-rich repeat (LRR) protein
MPRLYETQTVTAVDIKKGQIRIPNAAFKALGITTESLLWQFSNHGHTQPKFDAKFKEGQGSRSGTIRLGKKNMSTLLSGGYVAEGEKLSIVRGPSSVYGSTEYDSIFKLDRLSLSAAAPVYTTMDALATSPFALLDAHGSISLVTDAVHEDDALCLALACRAMRDALGVRFPACPRAGGRAVAELAARVTADGVLDLSYEPDPDEFSGDEYDGYGEGYMGLDRWHHGSICRWHLPEGFGRLAYLPVPGLRMLDLSGNRGRYHWGRHQGIALPEGLWTLAGLEDLDLRDCGLWALPEGIGGLTGLRKLDVSSNSELTALPAGLGHLPNLEELVFYGCPLAGDMDDLHEMHDREGLPALLAHLAAQGGEPAVGEAS